MAKEDAMTETLKKSAFITLDADEGASEQTLALLEAEDEEEEEFQFRIFLCTLAIVIPFVVVVISSLVLSSH